MTMLTLFKPWRSGKDLRPNVETMWNDVFANHQFTSRQEEIMRFFHIRYECNDARDDFASQRKQMTGSHKYPIHLDNDDMNEFDAQNVLFEYGATQENMTDEMVKGEDWKTKSRAEILRLGRNETAEMIMKVQVG